MVRKKKDIVKGLGKKGFRQETGKDHLFLWYYDEDNKSAIYTKVSHGSGGKDVGAPLISLMARQCKVSKQEFLDLVDCPMASDAYRSRLQEDGHI